MWALLFVFGCLIPIIAVFRLVSSTAVHGFVSMCAKLVMSNLLRVVTASSSVRNTFKTAHKELEQALF